MAISGKINRSGIGGKRVISGPGELIGPSSLNRTVGFAEKAGIRGPVDLYEISDGSGANEGTYTVVVAPFAENGFRGELRGVGKVALFKQTGGVNTPTAAISCVAARSAGSNRQSITLGPTAIATNDKAWVVVKRKGSSELRYQISLDLVIIAIINVISQPPSRSVTAPAATTFTVSAETNDGGTLSYQWQLSTDGGTSFSNVSNGGVYSGATTATLSISDSTGLTGNRYRVVITSSGDAPSVTTNAGTLTVA